MHIGPFLRAERQAREFSLERLAELAGVGRSALSQIERGHRSPRWATVERLLAAMGREAVLDTRLPAAWAAAARLASMSADARVSAEMPFAWLVLQRLERDGARIALDGPSAELLIGTPTPLDSVIHLAVPATDLTQICLAIRREGAQGWSERFRDFRFSDVEERVCGEPVTRWMTAVAVVSVRLVDDWRPVTVVAGERVYACLPAGVPTAPLRSDLGDDDVEEPALDDCDRKSGGDARTRPGGAPGGAPDEGPEGDEFDDEEWP
jgi:transcriptional regulator with XRE-family HTH domain